MKQHGELEVNGPFLALVGRRRQSSSSPSSIVVSNLALIARRPPNQPSVNHDRLPETYRASLTRRLEASICRSSGTMSTITLILALMLTLGMVFMTGVLASRYEGELS